MSEAKIPTGKSSFGGKRATGVRLKTAKGRKTSSTLWLQRQLNDPYVQAARKDGYRSRAAYKLLEIDDKFHFLKPGKRVLDLGAAPGGWTQVAIARTRADSEGAAPVVALDILPMDAMPGAVILHADFSADDAPAKLLEALGGKVEVVLSDIAPNTTGHAATDHIRIIMLIEMAYDFALEVLKQNGCFLAKVRQGGAEANLLKRMRQDFLRVKHVKPKASRQDSAEMYVLAEGFRGRSSTP